MAEFIEIITMPFFLKALIAGLLVSYLGSFYGVFVVQRRMSFLGDGLAHAAFGGIALGLLLQTEPLWIALPITVIISILITLMKEKTNLEMDTSIGIFFAVSMALGIVFISIRKNYSVDAFSYLFGSILLVQTIDLVFASILALVTIVLSFRYWKRWAYATFDSELARTDRLSTHFDDYLLSVLIAITIVLSIKMVGILLIASFLVIPAATAKLVSLRFYSMTMNSIIIGLLSTLFGILISILLNMPTGAVIILTQAIFFLIALVFSLIRK